MVVTPVVTESLIVGIIVLVTDYVGVVVVVMEGACC